MPSGRGGWGVVDVIMIDFWAGRYEGSHSALSRLRGCGPDPDLMLTDLR